MEDQKIDPHTRIQEAHGIWELAIARVAALADVLSVVDNKHTRALLREAVTAEREAFVAWRKVSRDVGC